MPAWAGHQWFRFKFRCLISMSLTTHSMQNWSRCQNVKWALAMITTARNGKRREWWVWAHMFGLDLPPSIHPNSLTLKHEYLGTCWLTSHATTRHSNHWHLRIWNLVTVFVWSDAWIIPSTWLQNKIRLKVWKSSNGFLQPSPSNLHPFHVDTVSMWTACERKVRPRPL